MAVADRVPSSTEVLRSLGDRFRPVTLADRHLLPVLDPLRPLFAGGGLQRGSTVAADGPLATSVALALVAEASGQGSWVVMVGLPSVGLVAAAELGVALDRVALVHPPPGTWAASIAALVDAVDLVLVGPGRLRPADTRRLAARARERGAVLVPVGAAWSEPPDVALRAEPGRWEGLGTGHGHLQARRVRLEARGRREATRPRSVELWLPSPSGGVAAVEHPTARRSAPARLRSVG